MQETLRLTAPPLLAFMDSQLRADDPDAQQRVTDFYRFIDAEEAGDRVHFSVKPGVRCRMACPVSASPYQLHACLKPHWIWAPSSGIEAGCSKQLPASKPCNMD